jgi:hypothetical protein
MASWKHSALQVPAFKQLSFVSEFESLQSESVEQAGWHGSFGMLMQALSHVSWLLQTSIVSSMESLQSWSV